MSIELQASRSYPGRTALHHKTHPESNTTTILDITPEDIKVLVQALTEAGHIKSQVIEQEELTVYGYIVVGRDGHPIGEDLLTQQEAIEVADKWTKDVQKTGIDWDYKVAAIVDQGGL